MNKRKSKLSYSLIRPRGAHASEYEVVSSRLLYYLDHGFEVATPISACYEKYQRNSPLQCRNWEAFADPRETTYFNYIALQKPREDAIDALLAADSEREAPLDLPAAGVELWEQVIAPQRFFIHGLQMVAAYVGQMAPSGRITLCALFQAADELRKIERIAYRLAQLRVYAPELGTESLHHWQAAPEWQEARKLCERLLVTYDFGEALVALNLVVKPLFDWLLIDALADSARFAGESSWAKVLDILREDTLWQRSWASELTRVLIADNPANGDIINGWIRTWAQSAWNAVIALHSLGALRGNRQLLQHLREEHEKFLISCDLRGSQEVRDYASSS